MTGLPSILIHGLKEMKTCTNSGTLQTCCKARFVFPPHHNWFISDAMTENEINQSLSFSEKAFEEYAAVIASRN